MLLALFTAFASASVAGGATVGAPVVDGPNTSSEAWPGGDPTVKPGTDFFLFANGGWLLANPIPADRVGFSTATELTLSAAAKVRTLLEEAAANADQQPSLERGKVGAYYAAFMDEPRIETLGATPLDRSLTEIRQAGSREALARLLGRANSTFHGSLFKLWIEPDSRNPDRYAIYLGQAGLGSLDRSVYLAPDAGDLRQAYRDYIVRLLSLVGWEKGDAVAARVLEFETKIAAASWTAAEERDESKIYNPTNASRLASESPEFPWQAYLQAANLVRATAGAGAEAGAGAGAGAVGGAGQIIAVDRSAIPALAALYSKTPIAVLKAWAAFHLTDNAAPLLSHEFADAWFDLHGRRLLGAQKQTPRWQRALAQVSGGGSKDMDDSRGAMGDAVGRLYTDRWFDARSRDTLRILVDNLRTTLRATISGSAWMSSAAKVEAIKKLDAYRVEIGMPEHGDQYDGLIIRRDDLFGDVERATAYAWDRDLRRLHHPTDRAAWTMTPQTVNAYNYAPFSEVVFTAALLQPPAFDPNQDSALTYGGIGAIIGHELTHGFDDVGRRFDATGHMRDWWTTTDNAHFNANAAKLVALFSGCEAAPGVHVDGHLTLGENIADIAGLQLAFAAYHTSLHGHAAPVINGLTGDQRFFLGFAKLRRGHRRPQTLRNDVASDPHTPDACRVNGDVRHIDGWYEAFGVTPESPWFIPAEHRFRLW
jgi:putative endopeptidase